MKVKICGIVNEEIALKAIEYGTDALGFVFAPSKRVISPEKAKEIVAVLPKTLWKVGVFVNEPIASLLQIARDVQLTHVQLHGDESEAYCKEIESYGFTVIKAVSIKTKEDTSQMKDFQDHFILVDSPRGKYYGGNGTTFDWSLINGMKQKHRKMILAGGLTAENVKVAISQCNPYMVDVSSGVEVNGEKSPREMKRFIEAVKLEEEVR